MKNVLKETKEFLEEKKKDYNEDLTEIALSCVDFNLTEHDLKRMNKYRRQVSLIYQMINLIDELEESENK